MSKTHTNKIEDITQTLTTTCSMLEIIEQIGKGDKASIPNLMESIGLMQWIISEQCERLDEVIGGLLEEAAQR